MFPESHRVVLAAVLPGFLILGCSTWRPVKPDPRSFQAVGHEVKVETWDRGSYRMVATNIQGDDLHGKDVTWTYTVTDSAAFHARIGVGRSPGDHEETLGFVSIPFPSILTIESRGGDAGKTAGVVILVLAVGAVAGLVAVAVSLSSWSSSWGS